MKIQTSFLTIISTILFIILSSTTFAQKKWQVSSGGSGEWTAQAIGSGWEMDNRYYADFDGDGMDDTFIYKNGQFLYSAAANTGWKGLNSRFNKLSFSQLRFGDFNGDGKTDVFFKWKNQYGYASGGKGDFIPLRKADIPLKRLGFGDFNGDGKTDILWQQ